MLVALGGFPERFVAFEADETAHARQEHLQESPVPVEIFEVEIDGLPDHFEEGRLSGDPPADLVVDLPRLPAPADGRRSRPCS